MTADTLPKLLAATPASTAPEVALREKEFGIWRSITWADYQARTRAFALGLRSLGLGAGDIVALIGDNRPDWVMGEIAAHAMGARSSASTAMRWMTRWPICWSYSGAKGVIAEDEEQVDKLLGMGDRVPDLRHIIYSDPRGMRKYADPRLLPAAELVRIGEAAHAADPGAYDRLVEATRGEDVAILCTTSGTTARPKLAMLPAAR